MDNQSWNNSSIKSEILETPRFENNEKLKINNNEFDSVSDR